MGTVGLLEREAELAQLDQLLKAVDEGDGRILVVEGPPGIGKTRLMQALRARADDEGIQVLAARGGEQEQQFSFGVARQLFEATVAEASADDRSWLLAGAAGLAAPLLDPTAVAEPLEGDPFPLLHGLYWLVSNLAERTPLVVAVDDAHWADRPSLAFLQYLSRRLDGLPVLVCLAYRSTEPEAPVAAIEAIKREPASEVVRPLPLSTSATRTLLAWELEADPAAELVRAAHDTCAGNPFLLTELSRTLVADGLSADAATAAVVGRLTPASIQHATLGRLARLAGPTRMLARALALLGEDAALRHAAALVGVAEKDAGRAVDQLAAAGFVDPQDVPTRVQFTHPLLRQVIYGDLGPAERAHLHRQAARMLAADDAPSERAAAHLLRTGPAADDWVVSTLRSAASAASDKGAPEIAATYLRRALDEPPVDQVRAALLLQLGQAEAQSLDPRATAHLMAAADQTTDPIVRATARATADIHHVLADRRDGLPGRSRWAFVQEMVDALDGIPAGSGGEVEAGLLRASWFPLRAMPEGLETTRRLLSQRRLGPMGEMTPAELARLVLAGFDAATRGQRVAALQAVQLVVEQTRRPEVAASALLLFDLGHVQTMLGQYSEAAAHFDRVLADARRRGDRARLVLALGHRMLKHLLAGDLPQVVADAEVKGELLGDASDQERSLDVALGLCLLEMGDVDQAQGVLVSDLPDESPAPGWEWLWATYAAAQLSMARRQWRQAWAYAMAAGDRLVALEITSADVMPWRSLAARAMAADGRPQEALSLAHEELALARAESSPRSVGVALTTLGQLQQGEQALDALAEAVETLAHSGARLEHAKALCAYGAVLRRMNRRASAREPLGVAIELARQCGAMELAERAHAELRATGARPRRLALAGVDALTSRERQTAELAAAGHSNPEIAQQLFVTRKTVETHLSSAYRKLGVDSRDHLASALDRAERAR